MIRVDPDPPRDIAALLVFGTDVSGGLLEDLGIQFELFLESVDRGPDPDREPAYRWSVSDPSFRGQRVLVEASPVEGSGSRQRPVGLILDEVRQGIALLGGSPRRPPTFNDASLDHLARLAAAVERPDVRRMAYYANRESELITAATLANLRDLRAR